jgi:hypothetical protein
VLDLREEWSLATLSEKKVANNYWRDCNGVDVGNDFVGLR